VVDQLTSKRQQINVRLANVSLEHLDTLKAFFGIRSTTALVAFLIADAVHRLNVKSVQPPASSLASVAPLEIAVEEEDDENEIDVPRFGRQVAQQNRIDRQRAESK